MPTIRTVVDFYMGRGASATYLGTGDTREAEVAQFPLPLRLFQNLDAQDYTEVTYQDAVMSLVRDRRTVADTTARWPHPYTDSSGTPWAVAYDQGTVYVYRYGVEMLQIRCNTHRWVKLHEGVGRGRASRPVNFFPDMKGA